MFIKNPLDPESVLPYQTNIDPNSPPILPVADAATMDNGIQSKSSQAGVGPNAEDYISRQGYFANQNRLPQPPVNSVPAYDPNQGENTAAYLNNASPVSSATPKLASMFDLLKSEEPVDNTNTAEKVKKAAFLDSIGQIFGNIAGAVGGVAGAYIAPEVKDQNMQKLYGILSQNQDKYDALHRQWQSNLNNAAYMDQNTMLQQQAVAAKAAQDQRNYEADQTWKKLNYLKDEQQMGETSRHNVATENNTASSQTFSQKMQNAHLAIDQQNANKPTSLEERQANAFQWKNPDTNEQKNFNTAEFQQVLNQARVLSQKDTNFNVLTKGLQGAYQTNEKQAQMATAYLNYKNQLDKVAENRVKQANIDKPFRMKGVGENNPSAYNPAEGLNTNLIPGNNNEQAAQYISPSAGVDAKSKWSIYK